MNGRLSVFHTVKWTSDGRAILFAEWREPVSRIMRVPAEGGTPLFTGLEDADLNSIDPSPDGQRLAFSRLGNRWEMNALEINPSLLSTGR